MNASVGIDIGGTFTDVMICPDGGGPVTIAKVPTTPRDPGEGLVAGLTGALAAAGLSPDDVSWLVHGTTVGTNAVLEHDGARIGIITTCGFEDLLYIGRAKRSAMYDLFTGPATPGFLCPRRRIRGVPGRVSPGGATIEPLDERAVEDAIDYLTDVEGVTAIAVCLLFSFANPAMERRIQQIIRARRPAVHASLSSNIDPRFREFERLVVTALDAYIRPKVGSYLHGLRGRLGRVGVSVPLQVMESHGGIVASDLIEDRAVGTLLSGLAGGAIGAAAVGAAAGRDRVLSFDMGGTSTDITLVEDGRPLIHDEGRIADQPLRLPMVDVRPIGAGGGSIAYVDAAGSLRVGPRSAGADPAPPPTAGAGASPRSPTRILSLVSSARTGSPADGFACHGSWPRRHCASAWPTRSAWTWPRPRGACTGSPTQPWRRPSGSCPSAEGMTPAGLPSSRAEAQARCTLVASPTIWHRGDPGSAASRGAVRLRPARGRCPGTAVADVSRAD